MIAQRCMGWHLTSLGTSHLNSLTDMSNAFSCTKRENAGRDQRLLDGADATQPSVFSEETRRRLHFHGETRTAHGNVGGATHPLLVFRQDTQTLEIGPPHCTVPDASIILRKNVESPSRRVWERRYVRMIYSSKTSYHTAPRRPRQTHHHSVPRWKGIGTNRISRKPDMVPCIRRYGEQRRLTALILVGNIVDGARHLGDGHAFNESNKAGIQCMLRSMTVNWSHWEALGSHAHPGATDA